VIVIRLADQGARQTWSAILLLIEQAIFWPPPGPHPNIFLITYCKCNAFSLSTNKEMALNDFTYTNYFLTTTKKSLKYDSAQNASDARREISEE